MGAGREGNIGEGLTCSKDGCIYKLLLHLSQAGMPCVRWVLWQLDQVCTASRTADGRHKNNTPPQAAPPALTTRLMALRMSVISSTGTRPPVSLTSRAAKAKMSAATRTQNTPEDHTALHVVDMKSTTAHHRC